MITSQYTDHFFLPTMEYTCMYDECFSSEADVPRDMELKWHSTYMCYSNSIPHSVA